MFKFNQARTLELVGECLPTYGIKQPLLIPAHLHGTEAIGSLFEYTLTCRTANTPNVSLEQAANIDLNALLKQEVTLHIQIEGIQRFAPGRVNMENVGAGVREISAIIDQAEMLGEETERSYLYRFRLRPWLSLAETGQKRRLFHNMSVVDITRAVLEAYPYAVEYRLNAPWGMDYWPLREVQRQHDESDAVFLHRLWQEWGIFYHFKHENGRHCLVLNNKIGALQRHGEAYQTIRYTGPAEKRTDEETIHTLSIANKLVTGPVTINDYDYSRSNDAVTRAGGGDFQFRSDAPHDHVHTEQAHDMWGDFSQPKAGALGIADAGHEAAQVARARDKARLAVQRVRHHGRQILSLLLGLVAGYTLHIVEHPQKAANCEYSVLSATLTAEEVAQSSGVGQYRYSASFTLLPQSCLFYLPRTVPKPNIGGTEYAMVIAPAGAPAASETWTDSLGRVLIRYLWAGKSEHGDAPNSMWVRVLSPWQGSEFGATFLPRIGHEVEVAFVGGDPDLPVIIGSATNHWRHPGYALPGNAALAGFRSREFGQHASSNTVVMDDTQGKIQAQIASDHGTSHLALGYNTRIAGTQGRQDERGRGFELRTDLWGVLRSGLGMLISTDKREQARGHAKDAGEAIQRLTQARDIHETQAQLARQHLAHDGTVNQDDVVTAIKAQAQAIRGNAATPEAPFPEFDQPHLTLASPAGIQTATAGSTHVASDVHTALTSGKHISLSAGRSLMATVRDRISLFAYKLGVRITAASGRVEIEAQNDQLSVIAHKVVDIISKADWINLTGQQGIRLNGGGSVIEISKAGITGFTGGQYMVHAATHATADPLAQPVQAPMTVVSEAKIAQPFVLVENGMGLRVPDQPYRITLEDGQVISGRTNDAGELQLVLSNAVQTAFVEILHNDGTDNPAAMFESVLTQPAQTTPPEIVTEKRASQPMGGKQAQQNDDAPSPLGHSPLYALCKPYNWGLRYTTQDAKTPRQLNFPVIVEYTKAMTELLLEDIQWGDNYFGSRKPRLVLQGLPLEDQVSDLANELRIVIGKLLTSPAAGEFALPKAAVPLVVISDELIGKTEGTKGVFTHGTWTLALYSYALAPIFSVKEKWEAKSKIQDFVDTVCHETRHCQQFFWMFAMAQRGEAYFPDLPNIKEWPLAGAVEGSPSKDVAELSGKYAIPDDSLARAGIKQMAIGAYIWCLWFYKKEAEGKIKNNKTPWYPKYAPDAYALDQEYMEMKKKAEELLNDVGAGGTPIDVERMVQDERGEGYHSRPWENDAFYCGNMAGSYWQYGVPLDGMGANQCSRLYAAAWNARQRNSGDAKNAN